MIYTIILMLFSSIVRVQLRQAFICLPWLRAGLFGLVLGSGPAHAGEITVAVASNFVPAAQALGELWAESGGQSVRWVSGSTGQHFAQLRQGAPFDAWLAADETRPARWAELNPRFADSRFTYAIGRLALWSADPDTVDETGAILRERRFRRLAIANPDLAPYGRAAMDTLRSLGIEQGLEHRLVRGQNVGQAFQFAASGNAELGLVALSLVRQSESGSSWLVPGELHRPIVQQAMAVSEAPAAVAFLAFLRTAPAHDLIRRYGYDVPDEP